MENLAVEEMAYGLNLVKLCNGLGGFPIFLPKPQLLHGSYKTLDQEGEPPDMIECFRDRVHIGYSLHFCLKDKYTITSTDLTCFEQYQTFWNIGLYNQPLLEDVYPGLAPCPPTVIDVGRWARIHPLITYWATFTLGNGEDVTSKDVNGQSIIVNTKSPSFFGIITTRTIEDMSIYNSSLNKQYMEVSKTIWDEDEQEMEE